MFSQYESKLDIKRFDIVEDVLTSHLIAVNENAMTLGVINFLSVDICI